MVGTLRNLYRHVHAWVYKLMRTFVDLTSHYVCTIVFSTVYFVLNTTTEILNINYNRKIC